MPGWGEQRIASMIAAGPTGASRASAPGACRSRCSCTRDGRTAPADAGAARAGRGASCRRRHRRLVRLSNPRHLLGDEARSTRSAPTSWTSGSIPASSHHCLPALRPDWSRSGGPLPRGLGPAPRLVPQLAADLGRAARASRRTAACSRTASRSTRRAARCRSRSATSSRRRRSCSRWAPTCCGSGWRRPTTAARSASPTRS